MDAAQKDASNPFGMDEACENCGRCETRETVVHGYGDVGADFLFVSASPSVEADARGEPVLDDGRLGRILRRIGFLAESPAGQSGSDAAPESDAAPGSDASPESDSGAGLALENAYVTHLVRCHGPDAPTDGEVAACDPFLTAEIRMINPHVIVPIGGRTLEALAIEYTTSAPGAFDVEQAHATTIRGRGFELVPMLEPERQDDADAEAFVDYLRGNVLDRDYRQTKGRQER
ncbi:MAG: uracil-DNA glycosylase family protein [Haloferacaceae archaeon]